jgi:hypothetical protein
MKFKTKILTYLLISFVLVFSGCGNNEKPVKPVGIEESVKVDKHPETKNIEAADGAGYNGTAIRKKVDGLIDKTEENNKKLEELQDK